LAASNQRLHLRVLSHNVIALASDGSGRKVGFLDQRTSALLAPLIRKHQLRVRVASVFPSYRSPPLPHPPQHNSTSTTPSLKGSTPLRTILPKRAIVSDRSLRSTNNSNNNHHDSDGKYRDCTCGQEVLPLKQTAELLFYPLNKSAALKGIGALTRSFPVGSLTVLDTGYTQVHRPEGEPFAALNDDLVVHILSRLSRTDLLNAALVCKTWNRLAFTGSIWPSLPSRSRVHFRISQMVSFINRLDPNGLGLIHELDLRCCVSYLEQEMFKTICTSCRALTSIFLSTSTFLLCSDSSSDCDDSDSDDDDDDDDNKDSFVDYDEFQDCVTLALDTLPLLNRLHLNLEGPHGSTYHDRPPFLSKCDALTKLTDFTIRGMPMSDLVSIAPRLSSLTALDYRSEGEACPALDVLKYMPRLCKLRLGGDNMDMDGRYLKFLPNLTTLHLKDQNVVIFDERSAACPDTKPLALQKLCLLWPQGAIDPPIDIRRWGSLREATIVGPEMTLFVGCPQLRDVRHGSEELSGSSVDMPIHTTIEDCQQLERLTAHGSTVTIDMKNVPNLRELRITARVLSNSLTGIAAVAPIISRLDLHFFNAGRYLEIPYTDFHSALSSLPSLSKLTLAGISFSGGPVEIRNTTMTSLSLRHCTTGHGGCCSCDANRPTDFEIVCPSLRSLVLYTQHDCRESYDIHCPKLEDATFSRCHFLNDDSLYSFLTTNTNLRSLKLRKCHSLSRPRIPYAIPYISSESCVCQKMEWMDYCGLHINAEDLPPFSPTSKPPRKGSPRDSVTPVAICDSDSEGEDLFDDDWSEDEKNEYGDSDDEEYVDNDDDDDDDNDDEDEEGEEEEEEEEEEEMDEGW